MTSRIAGRELPTLTSGELIICEAIVEIAKARVAGTKKATEYHMGRAQAYLRALNITRDIRSLGFNANLYNAIRGKVNDSLLTIHVIASAGTAADWNMEENIIPVLRKVQGEMRERMLATGNV